jgi:hypothetical protein
MIGKLVRMFIGRSMAKKRGYSGAAGAAAGLLAPIVLKQAGSMIAKGGSKARQARRRRREPKYLRRIG